MDAQTFVALILAVLVCLVANAPLCVLLKIAHKVKGPSVWSSTYTGLIALALSFTLELLGIAAARVMAPDLWQVFALALIVTFVVLWALIAVWATLKATRDDTVGGDEG